MNQEIKNNIDDPVHARIACYGLAIGCPLDQSRPACPFKCIQHLSVEDRIDWIEKKNDNDCIELFTIHCHCLPELSM